MVEAIDPRGVVVAYLAVSLAMGAALAEGPRASGGFLVADRSVRDWVLAFTFGATYFSSVVMVVGSSWAYAWGPLALVIPLANIGVGALLAFIIVGVRANRLSDRVNALTVPELVAKLHGDRGLQRIVGSIAGVGLFLYLSDSSRWSLRDGRPGPPHGPRLRSGPRGGRASYVALGGMYGVVVTDVVQGLLMALLTGALVYSALPRLGVPALNPPPH